ncbi:MAG TPA: hypothetical protein VN673_09635, partial [Clostridia bacterium]|nr:hypothetical protein [Clostridia bacterium]
MATRKRHAPMPRKVTDFSWEALCIIRPQTYANGRGRQWVYVSSGGPYRTSRSSSPVLAQN